MIDSMASFRSSSSANTLPLRPSCHTGIQKKNAPAGQAGFTEVRHEVSLGIFSEYTAIKPDNAAP